MDARDDDPELAGYDPDEDRPLRSPRMMRLMRIVVTLGLVGLVLPGILITASTAARTADAACELWVARNAPGATGSSARFEFPGPEGPGWGCYALMPGGRELYLVALGLIPGLPVIREDTGVPS